MSWRPCGDWCGPGRVTNDTPAPLRSLAHDRRPERSSRRRAGARRAFRSRRALKLPGTEGRWSLFDRHGADAVSLTERKTAVATQLVERYGILTREMVVHEGVSGGFAGMYPILKAMEESGGVRRGYFVAGQGSAQFAAPGAKDRLREEKNSMNDEAPTILVLATTDPANPYGSALRWPESSPHVQRESHRTDFGMRPQRTAVGHVILRNGELIGYLSRTGEHLITFFPSPSQVERGHMTHL